MFRKKEVLIISLVFMLSICSVFAEDFKGYKYPKEQFVMNGDNFTIMIDNQWTTTYFKVNGEAFTVEEGDCVIGRFYQLCFYNAIFDTSLELGKLEERSGAYIPSLNISITNFKPNIAIKKTVSLPTPLVSEEVIVDLELTNNGNKEAMITLYEEIPENVTVTKNEQFVIEGNYLKFIGKAQRGNTIFLKYQFKVNKEFSQTTKTIINFTYEGVKGTIYGPDQKISTIKSVDTINLGSLALAIDSEEKFEIKMINKDYTSQEPTITIETIEGIEITSTSPRIEKKGEIYEYKKIIPRGEEEKITLYLKGISVGTQNLRIITTTNVLGAKQVQTQNVTVTVSKQTINPRIDIAEKVFSSNQKILIEASIKNSDSENDFYKITNRFITPDYFNNVEVEKIMRNQELKLLNKELILPTVTTSTAYPINLSGEYSTVTGQRFNFSITKTITIQPAQEVIIITHEFDKWENSTDKLKMSVYVENKKDLRTKTLEVYDDIPSAIGLLEGEIKTSGITVEPYSKKKAYYYLLKLPENPTTNSYEITTNIKYSETDTQFLIQKKSKIDALNKTIETKTIITNIINQTQNFTKQQDINTDKITPKETPNTSTQKKSWWDSVVDFFDNLFGGKK